MAFKIYSETVSDDFMITVGGVPARYGDIRKLDHEIAQESEARQKAERKRDEVWKELMDCQHKKDQYEKILFRLGVMQKAPCFKCGYNGPGYFQPSEHPCAKWHHYYYNNL